MLESNNQTTSLIISSLLPPILLNLNNIIELIIWLNNNNRNSTTNEINNTMFKNIKTIFNYVEITFKKIFRLITYNLWNDNFKNHVLSVIKHVCAIIARKVCNSCYNGHFSYVILHNGHHAIFSI